ncbi:PP2C family protein-serine/threonine phosphatase, partial [Actinomadura rubrisoli]
MSGKNLHGMVRSPSDRPSSHPEDRSRGMGAPAGDDRPDPAASVHRFAEAIVPRLADFAAVHLRDEFVRGPEARLDPTWTRVGPPLRRIVSLDATPSRRIGHLLPAGQVAHWTDGGPVQAALLRGDCVHISRVTGSAADHFAAQLDAPGLERALHGRSLLALPLTAHGAMLGDALIVGEPERPPYGEREVAMLAELARWAAAEIGGALRRQDAHQTAHRLWRESGPELPAHTAGIDLAYRYAPVQSPPSLLGGDWLDAIPLPGNRTALVVGDVAGHGAEVAVRMGRCKTMVRTLASLDLPPDVLLSRFDRLVRRLGEEYGRDEDFLATCVYAVYDPATRECRIASAGHVPPILVHPDGRAETLRLSPGTPIGYGGDGFGSCSLTPADGSLLALYSDGLVETRHQDLEEGIRSVATRLTGRQRPLEQTCDEVMAGLGTGERLDDVTLLLARLTGPDSPAPVTY